LEGDILITEAFTCQRFRNQNVHTRSSLLSMHEARERGLRRLIGLAAWWNSPALSAMRKAGRHSVGTVGFRRVLRGRDYFVTGCVRFDENDNVFVPLGIQTASEGTL